MTKLWIPGLFACLALIAAPTANAEDPPPPSSDDVTSLGTIGNEDMGASAGTGGWAAWSPLGKVETSGWPVSRTQISTSMGDYDATTSYNLAKGEIEHWSTLDGDNVAFNNWAEYYYGENIKQNADVRIGSQQLKCVNFMCKMVD